MANVNGSKFWDNKPWPIREIRNFRAAFSGPGSEIGKGALSRNYNAGIEYRSNANTNNIFCSVTSACDIQYFVKFCFVTCPLPADMSQRKIFFLQCKLYIVTSGILFSVRRYDLDVSYPRDME